MASRAAAAASSAAPDLDPDPGPVAEIEPSSRPLRRDAELNLERILAAAQDVFAEQGFAASMDQVAARAGVGIGTLYRRFPNKGSLVLAIMERAHRQSESLIADVLANSSAAEGLFDFMRRCAGMAPSLRTLVSQSPELVERHLAMVDQLTHSVNGMLANAKAAGAVRADATFSDIALILVSVRSIEDRCAGLDEGRPGAHQAARHLQILLDGLRPTADSLPYRPLTRVQLGEVLVRG